MIEPDHPHLSVRQQCRLLDLARAGLVEEAWDWRWSSAKAQRRGKDDRLVKVKPLLELVGNWKEFVSMDASEEESRAIRSHERTGRPLGSEEFLVKIERKLERVLHAGQVGRKRKAQKGKRVWWCPQIHPDSPHQIHAPDSRSSSSRRS